MNYAFHPAAESEHLESIAYYESVTPGLGAAYMIEFERAMAAVCEFPDRHPIDSPPDVRRVRMRRFPFTLLFRESLGTIQLLAVAHHRRRPNYWLDRL